MLRARATGAGAGEAGGAGSRRPWQGIEIVLLSLGHIGEFEAGKGRDLILLS